MAPGELAPELLPEQWPEVCAHLVACTGWTWCYIEAEVDLPRLAALNACWKYHPPTHLLLAAFMGLEGPPKPVSPEESEREIERFMKTLALG